MYATSVAGMLQVYSLLGKVLIGPAEPAMPDRNTWSEENSYLQELRHCQRQSQKLSWQ